MVMIACCAWVAVMGVSVHTICAFGRGVTGEDVITGKASIPETQVAIYKQIGSPNTCMP
jgi:hypothetical protein